MTLPTLSNWHTQPDIQNTVNLPNTPALPMEDYPQLTQQWLNDLANIAKEANVEAHKIATSQTTHNCRKAIKKKYIQMLDINPKKHKQIFQPQGSTPLDCLYDIEGNLATHLDPIVDVIYTTQTTSFQRQTPLCSNPLTTLPIAYVWSDNTPSKP